MLAGLGGGGAWNESPVFEPNEHFIILEMNEYVQCFTCFPNRPQNLSAEIKEAALRENSMVQE